MTWKLVELVSVPVIAFTPVDCDSPPLNPVPVGAVHTYVVPAGTMPSVPLTGVILNVTPLQTVADIGLIVASGLTVTVNVKAIPVHDPESGVTI